MADLRAAMHVDVEAVLSVREAHGARRVAERRSQPGAMHHVVVLVPHELDALDALPLGDTHRDLTLAGELGGVFAEPDHARGDETKHQQPPP